MALLAYDPERLAYLKTHLIAATDELRTIRTTDPAAAEAMQSVATIRNEIDQVWLPLITRILESAALTDTWWFSPDIGENLQDSLVAVMANGYGWSVQPDPLNYQRTGVTAAEARALGAMLNQADVLALASDREQLRWLAQQLLTIGQDPSLSANFLANFDSWPTLTYVFGQEHAQNDRPDITVIFDGLMMIWTHTLPPDALTVGKLATLDALLPPIDDVDPYVQALMVRSLHPDALTAATLTFELLTRWLALKNDWRFTFDRPGRLRTGTGQNAADLLLPLLLNDPAACVWLSKLAASNPAILFETLNDPELAYQVVLTGTDPANTTSPAAGQAVLAILDYFRINPYTRAGFDTDGHPGDYGQFLGSMVAPWLLQFTMGNNDWPATDGRKAALLRVALHDEQAMARLIADAERIRVGFTQTLSTYDIAAANQVGGLLNLLLQLSVNERVADEMASDDDRLNLLWTVVGVASAFLPGGPLVGIASGIALTTISSKLNEYLDQPDPTGVRRSAERAMDLALTLAGADALSGLHRQWVADGRVRASHPQPPAVQVTAVQVPVDVPGDDGWCPSAEYHDDFDQWRRDLPGGIDGGLSRQANDLLGAFIGTSAAQSNCAEIAG